MWNSARRSALVLVAPLLCVLATMFAQPITASRIGVWGTKPLLAYFVLNPEFRHQIKHDIGLSAVQFTMLEQIAIHESEQLRDLDRSSRSIIENESLSLQQRREQIEAIRYNDRLLKMLADGQAALADQLGSAKYAELIEWIERQWLIEQQKYSVNNIAAANRTYHVFATQYGAETGFEVAVPDKCLKFANRGWSLAGCPSGAYHSGQNYSVRMTYNGNIATSRVWDVGPWNEDDNYWSTTSEAQSRRLFRDLPLGMPEAQAAYFDRYNGGRDQFGRIVANPAGIDLSDGVRRALGLRYLQNAWIDVTYLWTSGTSNPAPTPSPAPTPPVPVPTPAPAPAGIMVRDNDDPNVERGGTQQYLRSAPSGSIASNKHATWTYTARSTQNNYLKWKPPLDRCGNWEVFTFMPYIPNGVYDTSNAVYRIRHRIGATPAGVESIRTIDQNAIARLLGTQRGDRWISLGTYLWSSNAGAVGEYILLGDSTGETDNRGVNFDDMAWVYRGSSEACSQPTAPPVPKQPYMWMPLVKHSR